MKSLTWLALICFACCVSGAFSRDAVHGHLGGHRALHAEATAAASGSQSASASASASSVNGQEQATTASNATGAGATTYGQSAAAGQIDVCVNGPNQNYSSCRTFAPSVRSSQCTDVPPDDRYTCAQQVSYGKCDADFMFLDSYCLKSCNRCGSQCTDVTPSSGSCQSSMCNSKEYESQPVCLKTCGRCSTAS